MKSKTITIRASESLQECLKKLSKHYECSQSDLIHGCIYAFNDYQIADKNNSMCKYIIKYLKRK